MLVLTRARVPVDAADAFRTAADDLLGLLSGLPGFVRGHLGRAADDPELWVVASEWVGVGAYRRALSSYDVKMTAPAVMAHAVPEPSAFEVLGARTAPADR
ncbi:MAG: antibiotic biosynthesis monooxygenase [Sporichthyaceae bacterium]